MKRPSPLSGKVQFKAKKLRIYCGSTGGQQLNETVMDTKKLEIFFSNESAADQIQSLKAGTHPKFLETTRPFLELKERKEWIIEKFSRTRMEMVESQTKELEKFCEKQYEQSLSAFKEKLLAKCNEDQKKFAEEMKEIHKEQDHEQEQKKPKRGGRKRAQVNNITNVLAQLTPPHARPLIREPTAVDELNTVIRLSDKDIKEDFAALSNLKTKLKVQTKNYHKK
jgi:hypothetical protein